MAFWGESLEAGTRDPKRKFRWRVEIGGMNEADGLIWYAKNVDKPKLKVGADVAHKFLGHTFKFPGSVTWDDITITLVDPVSPDAAAKLLNMVHNSGYKFPESKDIRETISKGKATAAGIQSITISQLAADGQTVVERWQLHNPFINAVDFDQLSYDEDGLSEITLGITYDWAKHSAGPLPAEGGGQVFQDGYVPPSQS